MPHDARKYLFDIKQACDRLNEFVTGRTFKEYTEDALLRSAVERQFEIIGEALNQMLQVRPDLASAITDVAKIISFRTMLIHGYAEVSHKVVWGVAEKDLPVLQKEVENLLENQE